jgi:hypothetical protein
LTKCDPTLYNEHVSTHVLRSLKLISIIRVAWQRWQIIGKINGDYIARFVTNLFYFTILVPFAIITKFLVDPLELRKAATSHWKEKKPVGTTLDEVRSQF